MFERNPLVIALNEIKKNTNIQNFLNQNLLTEKYVNRYLWYTIINHGDERACKEYLKLLITMKAKGKLDIDTLMQLLQPPQGEARNIGEMIAETFSRIDCILLLTDLLEGLPREQFIPFMPCTYTYFRNTYTKEDMLAKADAMLEPQASIDYCLRALDEESPLGYIMYLQRGCYPCEITEGTLGEFLEVLTMSIEAQKEMHEAAQITQEVIDEVTRRVNASREQKSKTGVFTTRVDSMLKLLRSDDEKDEKTISGGFSYPHW